MKYFLTSPDINEQKPPWLASPGPGEARIMTISRCGCSGSVTGTWDSGPGINQQRRQHGDRGRDVTTTCRCSVQWCGDLMLIGKLQSISGVFVMCVWCVYGVCCTGCEKTGILADMAITPLKSIRKGKSWCIFSLLMDFRGVLAMYTSITLFFYSPCMYSDIYL